MRNDRLGIKECHSPIQIILCAPFGHTTGSRMFEAYLQSAFKLGFGKGLFTAKNFADMQDLLRKDMPQLVVVFLKDHQDLKSQADVLKARLAEWRPLNQNLFRILYCRLPGEQDDFDAYIYWASLKPEEIKQALHKYVEQFLRPRQ